VCGVEIDALVIALGDALVDAGIERPRLPRDDAWLARAAEMLAPLRLPAELERFWQLVEPATLHLDVFPNFTSPAFALDSWIQVREQFPYTEPHNLLLVGYRSWSCMWIELDDGEGHGGTLFDGALDDETFFRRFNRLEDWLGRIVELIGAGAAERIDNDVRSYLRVEDPRDELALAAPRDVPPHPSYGERIEIDRNPLDWPVHWQRASGIDPTLRGATHTIAEVLAFDPAAGLRATIAGHLSVLGVTELVSRVRVSDGTGEIDVSCPRESTPFGLDVTERSELDITVQARERQDGSPDDTEDLAERFERLMDARYGRPAAAVATAVRPLDPGA
jgi:hypothetical protein